MSRVLVVELLVFESVSTRPPTDQPSRPNEAPKYTPEVLFYGAHALGITQIDCWAVLPKVQ